MIIDNSIYRAPRVIKNIKYDFVDVSLYPVFEFHLFRDNILCVIVLVQELNV